MTNSTKNLKRTLGKKELFAVAIGQIIGSGIMALTGVAIALTGRSANLSFVLAAIAIIFVSIPTIFLTSTIRMRGGQYTQAAIFGGKNLAGMYIIIFIIANISLAMYAISFAEYFMALVPGIPYQLVAIILVTVLFAVNYFGVNKATKIQAFMVTILAIALISFVGFGLPQIQPGYFEQPGFITNGTIGLLTAMAFLTFATGGATVIVNLSAEAINPKKDIPIVIIISTLAVAVLYAFMATVAAGVLPIDVVANQPLTHVAKEIFPSWLYIFFIVGGAMFALVTTLNAQISFITKPVMQAAVDGWFPKSFAKLHPKYNTPTRLLIVFYFVAIIPIITGFNVEMIANSALILNYIISVVFIVLQFKLPKLFKEQWEKSPFKVKNWIYYSFLALGAGVSLFQACLMFYNLDIYGRIGNCAVFVIAIIFGLCMSKKADMEVSVEDD
ncbi:MAG: APC family permease [Erysipelotrichaceae bacterium]